MQNIRKVSDFLNEYKFLSTIGKSKVSVIKEVICNKDNKCYAAKIIEKNKNKNVYNEYKVLVKIQNIENVIKLYDAFEDELYFLLILEKLKPPDISEYLDKNGPMKELNVKKIIYVIAKLLTNLHKNGIVHIDIKPDNIMCDYAGKIYLFDFGLSREIDDLYNCCSGTIYYVSPEIIDNTISNEISERKIGIKTDIWSLGISMYVMLFKEYPFFSNIDSEIPDIILNEEIYNNPKFNKLNKDARDLLDRCLKKNPDERISANEILNHDWLSDDLF